MPVQVELLPDEPIVIAVLWGDLTVEDIRSVFAQSAELVRNRRPPIYRILDLRSINVSLNEIIEVLTEGLRNIPGSSADARFKDSLVGSEGMPKLYVDFMRKKTGSRLLLPMYTSFDTALHAARQQIADG